MSRRKRNQRTGNGRASSGAADGALKPFVVAPKDVGSDGTTPGPAIGVGGNTAAGDLVPPQLNRRQLWLALSGVLLSIIVAALDQTIVGTALPRIVAELNGFSLYTWVVSSYLLTATIVIPIAGKLSDQFGRKPIIIFGLLVFVAGSMLSGASQTMLQLVIFRGCQGIGAGALQAGAFASIGDLFPPVDRGRWQGVIAAAFGIASILGPSLGGWITDNPGWRWVFYVNVPVGALAFFTLLYGFPSAGRRSRKQRIDWLGVATIIAATTPLLIALTWAGVTYPWLSVQVIGLIVFSVVMFVAFALVERHNPRALLPLDLFGSQIFTAAAIASFFIGPILLGLGIYLPLFVQGVLKQSATNAGAVITPLTVGSVITNIAGGQLISRTGRYRVVALVGLVITLLGLWLLVGMGGNTSTFTVVFNMLIVGAGLGFVLPTFTIAVQNALPYNRLGVVTASVQFTRSIGSTIGISALGSILTNLYATHFASAQTPQLKRVLDAAAAQGHAVPSDPQVLVSPEAQGAILSAFKQLLGPQAGTALYQQFLNAVQNGLLAGLHTIFLALLLMAVVSLIAALFLKEVPLRTTNDDTALPPSAGKPRRANMPKAHPAKRPAEPLALH
ncbi:MAG: MDR family MFS transporter [Ktedonobacterales bacterium]